MTSILTNNGAMVALQTLNMINNNLQDTQSSIATGKEINGAKDNSAIWSISKVMESDVDGFEAISESISLAESTVAVASAGAEQITDILKEVKEKLIAATGENVNRTAIKNDITALSEQITSIIDSSQFNGANLLNKLSSQDLTVLSSLNRDKDGNVGQGEIKVDKVDLDDKITYDFSSIDLMTDATVTSALTAIEKDISNVIEASAQLGSAAKRLEIQNEFVNKVSDTMKSGIGSLVDTDMEEASARLKALQTQQQLGVQALSIANSAPSTLQQLFR